MVSNIESFFYIKATFNIAKAIKGVSNNKYPNNTMYN